jgi:hypothetical protein
MVSVKGSLVDVCCVHSHLMISTAQIQFGEEAGTAQFIHDRDREHVMDSLGIHRTVVDVESPRTIMLFDEENR